MASPGLSAGLFFQLMIPLQLAQSSVPFPRLAVGLPEKEVRLQVFRLAV